MPFLGLDSEQLKIRVRVGVPETCIGKPRLHFHVAWEPESCRGALEVDFNEFETRNLRYEVNLRYRGQDARPLSSQPGRQKACRLQAGHGRTAWPDALCKQDMS